jgi:hypothetical protein
MRRVSLCTDINSKTCVLAPAIPASEKAELLPFYAAQFNCSIDPSGSILYQDETDLFSFLS